jgi:predicted house-cleaning noncanonical NTP pyrophosphatase (MazG superfamily)
MKLNNEYIESLESTLDNAVHEIALSCSDTNRDVILTEYYEFLNKLHNILKEETPEYNFKNFG